MEKVAANLTNLAVYVAKPCRRKAEQNPTTYRIPCMWGHVYILCLMLN